MYFQQATARKISKYYIPQVPPWETSWYTKTSEFSLIKFFTRQLWKINWNPARVTYSTHKRKSRPTRKVWTLKKKISTHGIKVWANEEKKWSTKCTNPGKQATLRFFRPTSVEAFWESNTSTIIFFKWMFLSSYFVY